MISLIVLMVIVGFALWLLNTLVPMDPKVKQVVNALVLVLVFLYVLEGFGIFAAPRFHGRWL